MIIHQKHFMLKEKRRGFHLITSEVINAIPGAARILIDVTPADSNYVYALASGGGGVLVGIFRSLDSGTTWTRTDVGTDIFDGSTQANYDLAFAVSPTNKDEI